jgi:hypothetical protein
MLKYLKKKIILVEPGWTHSGACGSVADLAGSLNEGVLSYERRVSSP